MSEPPVYGYLLGQPQDTYVWTSLSHDTDQTGLSAHRLRNRDYSVTECWVLPVAGRTGQQRSRLSCPDPTPFPQCIVPFRLRIKAEISRPGTPVQKAVTLHRPQVREFPRVMAPSAHTVLSFSSVSQALLCSRDRRAIFRSFRAHSSLEEMAFRDPSHTQAASLRFSGSRFSRH